MAGHGWSWLVGLPIAEPWWLWLGCPLKPSETHMALPPDATRPCSATEQWDNLSRTCGVARPNMEIVVKNWWNKKKRHLHIYIYTYIYIYLHIFTYSIKYLSWSYFFMLRPVPGTDMKKSQKIRLGLFYAVLQSTPFMFPSSICHYHRHFRSPLSWRIAIHSPQCEAQHWLWSDQQVNWVMWSVIALGPFRF